ncbi:MAG: BamA/TamA family outer membrane protein [Chitinophagaceae bacterium]
MRARFSTYKNNFRGSFVGPGRWALGVCLLFLVACNNLKHLPDNDALYTGHSLKLDSIDEKSKERKNIKEELSSLIRPKPNRKFLGMRLRLTAYNLAGNPKKEGSPASWLKNKFGEPPVLMSDVNLQRNVQVLKNRMENNGFFRAEVVGDTQIHKNKGSASYTVLAGPRFRVRDIVYDSGSTALQRAIQDVVPASLLKRDEPFSLDLIKDERNRIDDSLKQHGFYYFDPDYLIVKVDSTIGDREVNLYVQVKSEAPREARRVYRIRNVYIFPGYRLSSPSSDTSKAGMDFYSGYYVRDSAKLYKPRLFKHTMQFDPGDVYNRNDHNTTLSRLINLGLFRFVKNRLEPVPGDSALLDVYYYLTPNRRQALRGEVNASTKSNNLTGSSVTVGWRKRNAFRGGELLGIDATGGFEWQISGQLKGYNTYRYGLEGNLSFPRFLIPLFRVSNKGGFIPRTNLQLGFDVLIKQKLYRMNSFRAGFGYVWKNGLLNEHQLNPVAVNYVQPAYISQQYLDSIAVNPSLSKAVERQFILGSNYNYNFSQLTGEGFRSGFYFNGNVDVSGNIAGLLTGANIKDGRPQKIFDAVFSQYVRLETDFRYYLNTGDNSVLANRIIIGASLPYGNSTALPFVKQFFAGGNNSVRAFRSRALGPGSYAQPQSSDFLPDQSGDMKLELNTEWRMKLFSIVHGALFVDAGNIWLYNEDPGKPGAKFGSDFLKELAVGGGVGLRFDISFLVLRFDVAIPLRKPFLPDGERWVFDQISFSDASWRRENIVLNIGIGYPF